MGSAESTSSSSHVAPTTTTKTKSSSNTSTKTNAPTKLGPSSSKVSQKTDLKPRKNMSTSVSGYVASTTTTKPKLSTKTLIKTNTLTKMGPSSSKVSQKIDLKPRKNITNKLCLKRLKKELTTISISKLEDISVIQDKEKDYIWHITIKGPKNTPYVNGLFEYTFEFPEEYPLKPPECTIQTGIYHPDYTGHINGLVCIPLLKDNYSPSLSLKSIIIEIRDNLIKPEAKYFGINPDAYRNYHKNRKEFERIAKEWTQIYAAKYKWTKEKETKMLKESKLKKSYVTKTYKSINKFETKEIKIQKTKDENFTKKLLSKKCSGTVNKRETLLHVLHDFAKSQGKNCLFTNNKNNKNTKFINGISNNDNQKATLILNNLDGLIVTDNTKFKDTLEGEEIKTDDDELKKQICVLQDAIKYKKKNKTIENIREKLAKSYGVAIEYVVINDIYYGSAHVDYSILTELPRNGRVENLDANLRQQFHQFRDHNLHPLFFDFNFNIDDFDERGNKVFSRGRTYEVGPENRKKTYTQPEGWTRFGLKVLDGRYGNNHKWLHPFKDNGNWYRAYHGTKWHFASSIVHGDAPGNIDSPVNNSHAYLHPGHAQVHHPHIALDGNPVGRGVYCSPSPNVAAKDRYSGKSTIVTEHGRKTYKFMFQVCVDPDRIRICRQHQDIWVSPQGAHDCIRPYGILLKEVPN